MNIPLRLVKSSHSELLRLAGRRGLFVIAAYHGIAVGHWHSKAQLATLIAERLDEAALAACWHSRLTAADHALLAACYSAGYLTLPVTSLRWPWQLPTPRPDLSDLAPCERLMALGLLVAVYQSVGPPDIYLPATVGQLVKDSAVPDRRNPPPILPAAWPLAALVDDAVTILGHLAVTPGTHRPDARWPAPLLRDLRRHSVAPPLPERAARTRLHLIHRLLHQAGYLAHDTAGCRPTAAVARFLAGPPARRLQFLLAAWQGDPFPVGAPSAWRAVAKVDWPALTAWLLARLPDLPADPVPLDHTLAAWLARWGSPFRPPPGFPAPATAPPNARAGRALLAALLTGPLVLLGLVQTDGAWIAVSAEGRAWLQGAWPVTPPAVPEVGGVTVRLPALAAAPLRLALAGWADHRPGAAQDHVYTFTLATLQAGLHRHGNSRPLQATLQPYSPDLPAELQALLAAAGGPARFRLTSRCLLESDDPAALSRLHTLRGLRGCFAGRAGPHALIVRRPERVTAVLTQRGLLDPRTLAAESAPQNPELSTQHSALSTQHAVHLILALRLAPARYPAGAGPFAHLAAALYAELPPAERADLDDLCDALDAAAELDATPGAGPPAPVGDPQSHQSAVRAAISAGHTLRLHYWSATQGAPVWRSITPIELDGLYLTAYCAVRNDTRTFRLDRILALVTPAGSADPPSARDWHRSRSSRRRLRPARPPLPPADETAAGITPAPAAYLLPDFDDPA